MLESWKSLKNIVEYGDNYEVSNLGNVRNATTKKVLKGTKNPKGYLRVQLFSNGKCKNYFIHKLVALAFIPNPEGKEQVNHKKGKEKDNNRVDNLEWATRSENMQHAYRTGLEQVKTGSKTNSAVLTEDEVANIKKLLIAGESVKAIAEKFPVDEATISDIKVGRTWSHVSVEGFTPFKTVAKGENQGSSKLTEQKVKEIRELYRTGEYTYQQLGDMFGIHFATARRVVKRHTWKHVV